MSRCEEGWAFFKRESVNWCFTSVTKTDVTYSAAEASCVQFGATLSGLESQLEANAVVCRFCLDNQSFFFQFQFSKPLASL